MMAADEYREPKQLAPLQGDEEFRGLEGRVADFWRFALSDLRMNNTRGYFAEYLVARALGQDAVRVEWDDVDVRWGQVMIEVKSSAHLQSWAQRKPSTIKFSGLRGRTWDPRAGYGRTATYKADVYVFAWNTTTDPDDYDPLDVTVWAFYVLPRTTLERLGQDSLGLSTLQRLGERVGFDGLRVAIAQAAETSGVKRTALPLPRSWDRAGLEAVGFSGFVPFASLAGTPVPSEPGIYVVLRTATTTPTLLELTTARAGAAYPLADLESRWVTGTPVVYIGKAQPVGGLRKRLSQYARKGSSHRGVGGA